MKKLVRRAARAAHGRHHPDDRHGHGRRLGLGGPLSPQASSRSNNTKTRAELAKGRFCSFFLTSSGDESAQSSDLQIC